VKPASAKPILQEMDAPVVTPSSCLSPEGAIFSRYQKAVLRYTGTVVPDTRENRATAIRYHDHGLTLQEAGILQAMTLVESSTAVGTAALKEAVDALPPERLALMHQFWRDGVALTDQGGQGTEPQATLVKVLGSVLVVVLVAWGVLASLPGSDEPAENPPAPAPTAKQENPASDPGNSVELPYKAKLIAAQKLLKRQGLYESKVDGIYGPGTKAALEAFQVRNGLKQTGQLDSATFDRLTNTGGQ